MYKLGSSVYISSFDVIKKDLPSLFSEGKSIFTSFHVSEEFSEDYVKKSTEMLKFLKDCGYKVIADVSKKTLKMFNYEDILEFKKDFEIDILRIDYGYSVEEIIHLAKETEICLNASTVTESELKEIRKGSDKRILLIHNFYPKVESGLDDKQFVEMNKRFRKLGYEVAGFISSDVIKRGPMFEELVTLESHRGKTPYYQYVDMMENMAVDMVICGDGIVSKTEDHKIAKYVKTRTLEIEAVIDEKHCNLYNQPFTIRQDSPTTLKRLVETREYSCFGGEVLPENQIERKPGSICIDNSLFKRYSGEVTIPTKNYCAFDRVNVIGKVIDENMLNLIKNGNKIILKPSSK